MVPVPEELAPQVLTYVSWKGPPRLAGASEAQNDAAPPSVEAPGATAGDRGPIARAFDHLDEAGRTLVAVVATAALDHEQLTVPEAARRAGLSTRETVGTILELNALVTGEGGPPIAVFVKGLEGAEAVEFTWDTRELVMPEPIARPFDQLARAHAEG